MHITNVSENKWCHVKKGDIVGFTKPESEEVQYIRALWPNTEIKQQLQVKPRNWIPKNPKVAPIELTEAIADIDNAIHDGDNMILWMDLHVVNKRLNIKKKIFVIFA